MARPHGDGDQVTEERRSDGRFPIRVGKEDLWEQLQNILNKKGPRISVSVFKQESAQIEHHTVPTGRNDSREYPSVSEEPPRPFIPPCVAAALGRRPRDFLIPA